MNINYKDKLKTFIISKDTKLEIELPEKSSAGYLWQWPIFDNKILEITDFKTVIDPLLKYHVGAFNTRKIILISKNIGKTNLIISLQRSWETMPIDSFSISVEVI